MAEGTPAAGGSPGTPDFREIGSQIAGAFRLRTRPLAVYGSGTVPPGAVPLSRVDRCFAVALYEMASGAAGPVYASADDRKGCCPGGMSHVGFAPEAEEIRYFVSTGRPDVRGGAAEYLKANPELVAASFDALGKITPPGKFLIVSPCDALPAGLPGIRSLCIFGTAEQVRNLAALVHFDRGDPFSPVIVPWGPSCATFITYPAGMAERAPRETAFMGPQDPTQNRSLPPGMMAIGIPAAVAVRMAANIGASFVSRRASVAFPDRWQDPV